MGLPHPLQANLRIEIMIMEFVMPLDAPRNTAKCEFGSDAISEIFRLLGIPYLTLNPGASFRGLHDSIVNFLGNEAPQMLLCVHEEAAVAIAHGYAKVAGRPLVVALHSNVGLMHGSMGIFNAWCDRVPMIVIGATGPLDAAKRRPWIDWIHTAQDQGALIREFIKWDDQPGSVVAARWSLLQANVIAQTAPKGPVYVNLDAAIQEEELESELPPLNVARFQPPKGAVVDSKTAKAAASLLGAGKSPLIMMGRVSRDPTDWAARIALAECLKANVVTDFKAGSAFPTRHPLLVGGGGGYFPSSDVVKAIREADVILSLDWIDLGGTLRAAFQGENVSAKVVNASVETYAKGGWGKEAGGISPVDLTLLCEPDLAVRALLDQLGQGETPMDITPAALPDPGPPDAPLTAQTLAECLRSVVDPSNVCLVRAPLSWTEAQWDFDHPLSFLGYDGGGGIGSGTGMAIGAALALRDADPTRLAIAVLGDGDFLMNASALWTAASQNIPVLIVVANNQSFFNDEVHQEKVAIHRGRPPENKTIGMEMKGPEIDIAGSARSFGAMSFGPAHTPNDALPLLREAVTAVKAGRVAVVDARIAKGYSPAMASALRG